MPVLEGLTMGLTVSAVAEAVRKALECARAIEQELNAADGRLGDGDTGVTLRRVFERLAAVPISSEDLGAYFRALAMAAASATGSSLGTLTAVALASFGRETTGSDMLPWNALGDRLIAVRDAMLARGGASPGDKTVIDMIDAVANAIRNEADPELLRRKAGEAAAQALTVFRGRPCRMGRARMFSDKSVGLDDPGMLAFALLLKAVAGSGNASAGGV
jgi:hypothetical protein